MTKKKSKKLKPSQVFSVGGDGQWISVGTRMDGVSMNGNYMDHTSKTSSNTMFPGLFPLNPCGEVVLGGPVVCALPATPPKDKLTIQEWSVRVRDLFESNYGQGLIANPVRMREWLEAVLESYEVTDDPRWEDRIRAGILTPPPQPPAGEEWLKGDQPRPPVGDWEGDLFD